MTDEQGHCVFIHESWGKFIDQMQNSGVGILGESLIDATLPRLIREHAELRVENERLAEEVALWRRGAEQARSDLVDLMAEHARR